MVATFRRIAHRTGDTHP